jgi:hypothetical protein
VIAVRPAFGTGANVCAMLGLKSDLWFALTR